MGEALISRLISLETFAAEAIAVGDPSASRRQFLVDTYGVQAHGRQPRRAGRCRRGAS
jgi:pyrroline-5-carboxylate reductase